MDMKSFMGVFFMTRFTRSLTAALAVTVILSGFGEETKGESLSMFFPSSAISVREKNAKEKSGVTVIDGDMGETEISFKIAEIFKKLFKSK